VLRAQEDDGIRLGQSDFNREARSRTTSRPLQFHFALHLVPSGLESGWRAWRYQEGSRLMGRKRDAAYASRRSCEEFPICRGLGGMKGVGSHGEHR